MKEQPKSKKKKQDYNSKGRIFSDENNDKIVDLKKQIIPKKILRSTDKIKRGANSTIKGLEKYVRRKDFSIISVDIVVVKTKSFRKKTKKTNIIIEITFLYQINGLIRNKLPENSNKLRQLIENKLPARYRNYANVFNKIIFDKLLNHKTKIDHDIVLKTENNLLSNFFYNIFLEQLELIKDYFEDYFKKKFIVFNNVFYASPVLFVKKPGEK